MANKVPILMYTTRFCPYCVRARQLLKSRGLEFSDVAVDLNPQLRQEMTQRSGRRTVPQIWVGETHVGGFDELWQLDRTGKLDSLAGGS